MGCQADCGSRGGDSRASLNWRKKRARHMGSRNRGWDCVRRNDFLSVGGSLRSRGMDISRNRNWLMAAVHLLILMGDWLRALGFAVALWSSIEAINIIVKKGNEDAAGKGVSESDSGHIDANPVAELMSTTIAKHKTNRNEEHVGNSMFIAKSSEAEAGPPNPEDLAGHIVGSVGKEDSKAEKPATTKATEEIFVPPTHRLLGANFNGSIGKNIGFIINRHEASKINQEESNKGSTSKIATKGKNPVLDEHPELNIAAPLKETSKEDQGVPDIDLSTRQDDHNQTDWVHSTKHKVTNALIHGRKSADPD